MEHNPDTSYTQAAAITRAASKQTYYTIRLFADRDRVPDAFRAYGYFRWVDDVLDSETGTRAEKLGFVNRQISLLEACYRGETPNDICSEEWMLADLVSNDTEKNSGLQSYLRNMMVVMLFDAERRGQVISHAELSRYTRALAVAVTEAMYYFIGHDEPPLSHQARYLAVTAAHITHMLRDAYEDAKAGYFNISQEYLESNGISPQDVDSRAYREWVRGRVKIARAYFKAGHECTARVKNLRCRLAGFAYTARFEWMLRAIERDNYRLRRGYPARKGWRAGLWMIGLAVSSMLLSLWKRPKSNRLPVGTLRTKEL